VRSVLLRVSLTYYLSAGFHVPVLEDLFQIRPYAQVRDVIGTVRNPMRHVLRDDDNVTDHVTYLSIRPDLKKVLQHGYVNPALK